MDRKSDPSALAAAAATLEAELQRFERAAEEVRASRLESARNLDRGSKALSRAAEIEGKLSARVTGLVEAIRAADTRQQQATVALQKFGEELRDRQVAYGQLTELFAALGRDAGSVRDLLDGKREGLEAALARIEELDARALALADTALGAGFQDLAQDARGRHEQLRALLGTLGRVH